MNKLLSMAFACSVLVPAAAAAQPDARSLYAGALRREQAVRPSLAGADPAPSVLAEVRAVVESYEVVVRRFPTSGYSDNALWQAGRLEIDAYEKFHQARDRQTAGRLLRRLARVYINSTLAKDVPDELARLDDEPSAPAARSAGTPDRPSPPPPAPLTASAPQRRSLATIKSIRRVLLPDAVRITIEFDGEVTFHDERIPDPWRVFVDLPGTRAAPGLIDRTLRFDGDADLVRQIRIGRHPNNTTRVVLDAAGIGSYSVYPLYDPFRLVIDFVRANVTLASAASAPLPAMAIPKPIGSSLRVTPPLSARTLAVLYLRRAPSLTPSAAMLLADARATALATAPPAAVAARAAPTVAASESEDGATPPVQPPAAPVPAAPPSKNSNGGFSIARQLGLGVSRIVIDAGHGGHDPGAKGKGVTEAELVLDVALRLEKLLQKEAGTEVILTRRTDDFIPLQERTAIANREGADLFLSIHANASPNPAARGVETYFLNFANNLSAAAVAARENAASGQAMGALPDLVKSIALNNKLDESKDFATQVQHAMIERLRVQNRVIKDLGVKQAPFVVLIGAAMPSVLAEISFVTNTQEARLLKSSAYRQRIADALFNAIKKYQASLRSVTTVAHQED